MRKVLHSTLKEPKSFAISIIADNTSFFNYDPTSGYANAVIHAINEVQGSKNTLIDVTCTDEMLHVIHSDDEPEDYRRQQELYQHILTDKEQLQKWLAVQNLAATAWTQPEHFIFGKYEVASEEILARAISKLSAGDQTILAEMSNFDVTRQLQEDRFKLELVGHEVAG